MLTAIPEFLRSAAAFIVVLGVLVTFHELGHYLAARWRGVRVEAFSIGFGPVIKSWTDKHNTEWRISCLPLGGYVKMHGMERPQDVSDEVRASWIPGQTFHDKPLISRAIVIAAGPIANFLLAIVLFAGLFVTVGKPVALPVIGEVVAHSAADKAGLMVNDRIVSIAGQPIETFADLQRVISAHPMDRLEVTIHRGDADQQIEVTTDSREAAGKAIGVLGVRGGPVEYRRVGPVDAVVGGVVHSWDIVHDTFIGIATMVTGGGGTDEIGGPLRIAQLSGQVAQLGLASLVSFMAVLSVNLGMLNLFPIPVLDGGHLLFYLAEFIFGRPIPPRAQEYGFRAGLLLLASLFVFATWNDLSHLGLFH